MGEGRGAGDDSATIINVPETTMVTREEEKTCHPSAPALPRNSIGRMVFRERRARVFIFH